MHFLGMQQDAFLGVIAVDFKFLPSLGVPWLCNIWMHY